MLAQRIVAYNANTTNRSKFTTTACETIANTLVKYNATTSGTTGDGRDRAAAGGHPFTGLSVEADGAAGNSVDYYCSRKNLLEALQELSDLSGGGDFDIVKTSSTAWQWRWHTGQLGTDRSATVTFALDRGNMANPQFWDSKASEKTVAIVGGQGEESERDIAVRTGTNYSVTNDIEMFVNATDIDEGATAALQAKGDQRLSENEATKAFSFDALETENLQYGVNYFLGDKVTAINPYDGTSYTLKIKGVTVTLGSDGRESIALEMSEPLL